MHLMPSIRALHLAALAVLTGGFAFPLFVLHPSAVGKQERSILCGWLDRLRLWGTALAVVTWLAWLVAVAAGMSGLSLIEAAQPSVIGIVLQKTRFGHVCLIPSALLMLMFLYLAWQRNRRRSPQGNDAAGAALAAGILVSQVWAGHNAAAPLFHAIADAVHLTAAAVWEGSLLPLVAVLTRARADSPAWSAVAASAVSGFSGMGALAVGALAVTGFTNRQMMVGSLQALSTTSYGRLVTAKLVLFSGMVILAAVNRLWLTQRLVPGHPQQSRALRTLWRNVGAEIALGACIFAAVGALGGSEPPAHELRVMSTGRCRDNR